MNILKRLKQMMRQLYPLVDGIGAPFVLDSRPFSDYYIERFILPLVQEFAEKGYSYDKITVIVSDAIKASTADNTPCMILRRKLNE